MPELPIPATINPTDVCLLLRAHAEGHWLRSHVLPVVRELESPTCVPEPELGAALAYLEVLWLDAMSRGAETDAAAALLAAYHGDCSGTGDVHGDALLSSQARLLHASVRLIREDLRGRVRRLTFAPRERRVEVL